MKFENVNDEILKKFYNFPVSNWTCWITRSPRRLSSSSTSSSAPPTLSTLPFTAGCQGGTIRGFFARKDQTIKHLHLIKLTASIFRVLSLQTIQNNLQQHLLVFLCKDRDKHEYSQQLPADHNRVRPSHKSLILTLILSTNKSAKRFHGLIQYASLDVPVLQLYIHIEYKDT